MSDMFLELVKDAIDEQEELALREQLSGDIENDKCLIKTMEDANKYVYVIKKLDQEIAAINKSVDELIEKEIQKYEKYREALIKEKQNSKEYFEFMVRAYAENVLADGKKRSLKLPNGSIGFRKQQDRITYTNEEATLEYFQKHCPNLLKQEVKVSIDKKAVKEVCMKTAESLQLNGQDIPGITVVPVADKFEVK